MPNDTLRFEQSHKSVRFRDERKDGYVVVTMERLWNEVGFFYLTLEQAAQLKKWL
jgi:hypothetical protein